MKLSFPQQRNKVMRILKSTSVLVLLNRGAVSAYWLSGPVYDLWSPWSAIQTIFCEEIFWSNFILKVYEPQGSALPTEELQLIKDKSFLVHYRKYAAEIQTRTAWFPSLYQLCSASFSTTTWLQRRFCTFISVFASFLQRNTETN